MIESDIEQNKFAIVPFPIEQPKLIKFYTPKNAKYYITIYDSRWDFKYKELKWLWLDIEILRKRNLDQKPITWTMVRSYIKQWKDIKKLVPNTVRKFIKNN